VSVYNNPKLASLNGLQNLKNVGALLEISNNPLLKDLTGLPQGVTARNITLKNNAILTDISALSTFKSGDAGCALEITSNKALSNLNGMSGITKIGNLIIKSNGALSDVSALKSATIAGPIVEITNNGKLCEFSGVNTTASKVAGAKVEYACGKLGAAGGASAMDLFGALAIGALFLAIVG